ncbi:two-component system protein A [Amniculicola lignicola CBS 123094]|uniref:Two-component system protein A n=1 Tax=Amniculicola lignicola CBS 123094 TaxID=1392246 RepID=A0A6A5X1V5_9PLEO|nr:two-component system protein A [Amniculicola lignicola CBS 123094]
MSSGTRPLVPSAPPLLSPSHADFPTPRTREDGGSDALVNDIFSHTPIPTIILDPSLVIRLVSDSYLKVSGGFRRESVVGLHADAFFDHKLTLPSLDQARKALHCAIETKRPFDVEDSQANSAIIWKIRAVPILERTTESNGSQSVQYIQMELTDVTEEHLRQLELEERLATNETFRILVETVKDYAIFMLDPRGNVATWNEGAQRFKGYQREEIVGRHFSNFYSQEDRDNGKPERELLDALRDGRVEDEGWRYRKDGTRFWANVIITPVYRERILIGFSKVTRDLTERKKAEEKLIAAYEEASRLKSEFLANVSHEIRTPMHGMLSALTLLLDTRLNPEQHELAKVIEESGDVLLQVINDILDYSKLSSGSFSISHDIISVSDIILSVFRGYEKGHNPDVVLEHDLDPRLPKAAEGDSLRYRQIVQNLLSNATKFTEQGYIRIKATLQEEDDQSCVIMTEVFDSGIGVPLALSSFLFTPFTQFDNSATKRYKGTGLGLSICKSLAGLMGGNIGFRPNPDSQGSVFWFTAKLKKVRHLKHIESLQEQFRKHNLNSTVSTFEEIKSAATDKRVLLAEDNPINQKIMQKILASLGFSDIDKANDGREAVDMSTKTLCPYDVILMDINMPFLDGVAATKAIRAAGLRTPIIAMTANALKGQAESYIAKGMTGYIAKPVDRHQLAKILLKCFRVDEVAQVAPG